MVRATEVREIAPDIYLKEFYGLSTDTKPTANLATGSFFLEIDTCDVYYFNEESSEWIKAGGSNA